MKKYELVYFSDCRGISEVNNVRESLFESGLDVVKYVKKEREFEDDSWLEGVGEYLSNSDWYKEERWVDYLVCEGDVEGDMFIISMCDEFSEVLVIREDSRYYNSGFKRDVDSGDEYNVKLYYELAELIR
jgi:hypothetical protein